MSEANFQRFPSPNKKYPFVGPNYQQYQEQPGYVYYPYTDRYYVDPNAVKNQYQQQGLIKKDPTLVDQILPTVATLGAVEGAKYAGSQLPGLFSAAAPALGGGSESAIATALSTPATTGVGVTGTTGATGSLGTTLMGGGSGLLGVGALPLAGIAAGTYLGGKAALNMAQGKTDNSLGGKIGRYWVLAPATGGLSELARPFLKHESTRDAAKKHTKGLLGVGKDDAGWQSYVQGMRSQYDSAPTDPSKPFAGKYGSWDEYKKAGLEAGDLTGVYGNLKTFGPEWSKLSQDERQKVTQGIIDAGLYNSKKGEVEITDAAKAKQIKDQILGKAPDLSKATNPVGAPPPKGMLGIK